MTVNEMKLSVVIPSFNRAGLLQRTLTSVIAQKLPKGLTNLQIIVVDDGSTDGTRQLLKSEFPEVVYLAQSNQGVSAARNAGIHAADGDWLAFLDSDDEWLPGKLLLQFELIRQTGLLVCHTEEIWIRNGVRVNQMERHRKSGGWIFEQCLPLCAMSPSSIVIHQSVFERVGCFDPDLPVCEDYDMWLRIAANYKVAFVSQACLNKYGGHADQLSRRYWGMDRFRVIALEKVLSQPLQSEMRDAALTMLNTKLNILLKGASKHRNIDLISECETKLKRWAQ